jgi:hypothetical protein
MPNTTRDLDTQYRENFDYQHECAAGQRFFKGSMVGLNATGQAGNVSATFNKISGVMYLAIDAPAGVNAPAALTIGTERIQIRRGCHRFKQDGSITNANVGQVCRAIDDQSVGLAGGIAPAGVIQRVDTDNQVWVDFEISRSVAAGNGIV